MVEDQVAARSMAARIGFLQRHGQLVPLLEEGLDLFEAELCALLGGSARRGAPGGDGVGEAGEHLSDVAEKGL